MSLGTLTVSPLTPSVNGLCSAVSEPHQLGLEELTNEDINPIEASNSDTKISAAKITC